ncbi:hypothetical protein TKK_0008497 [Trichogramma kaykai]
MIICCRLSIVAGCKTFNSNYVAEDHETTNIPAHKTILAAASPVFRALFTHDMLENKENVIEIADTSYNILVEMCRFIYIGKINSIETDIILQILAVADKYQIDHLKIKCAKILCADLSTENVIWILIAAHKHNVKYLENEVMKFVATHIRSLIDFEKLQQIADPTILLSIIQSITKSQENPS